MFLLYMGQGATRDAIRNAPKEEYYNGTTGKTYYSASQRQNKEYTGRVASFIDPQHEIPVQLIYSLQRKQPLRRYGEFALTNIVKSDEAMVYITKDGSKAILCLVGQNIAKNSQHLIDDLNIAGITGGDQCELRLKSVAESAIKTIKGFGVPDITCIGYSLGGSTTGCVAELVTRTIILNGGAPPTNQPRPTPANCTCYHIVGDVLSTHWTEAKRIYLEEVKPDANLALVDQYFQIDAVRWTDVGYYHDMDRFMDYQSPYRVVDAQFEQNSLVNYLYYNKDMVNFGSGVAGGISSAFNVIAKLKAIICKNPIPGAAEGEACSSEDTAGKIAGGAFGGLIGGIAGSLAGGVGAQAGASAGATVGSKLLTGKTGLIDEYLPEVSKKITEAQVAATDYAKDLQSGNTGQGVFTGKIIDNDPTAVNAFTDGLVLRRR